MATVVTRTCPECGHRHSIAAETSEAAEFITAVEAERDAAHTAIREAARQLELALSAMGFEGQRQNARDWLALPVVVEARKGGG